MLELKHDYNFEFSTISQQRWTVGNSGTQVTVDVRGVAQEWYSVVSCNSCCNGLTMKTRILIFMGLTLTDIRYDDRYQD